MAKKTILPKRRKGRKKKPSFLDSCTSDLTPSEREVLYYLNFEFLTPKQISIRRGTTKRAVRYHIKNLQKKGAINSIGNTPSVNPIHSTGQGNMFKKLSVNPIRLHAQEFNIKILWKDYKYKKIREKGNTILIDGNTIRLYQNTIEVYSGHSFYGETVQKVTSRSFEYWKRFFHRLETDLKVIFVKRRVANIKLVNHHYAETNNELAQQCNRNKDKIRVYAGDDGKLWFTIDNSFNMNEAETQHPETAAKDMQEVVRPFFNDLRDNNPPTLSELMCLLKDIIQSNRETAAGLNSVVKIMYPEKKQEQNGHNQVPNYIR